MSPETMGGQETRPAVGEETPGQAPDRAPTRVSLARGLTAGLVAGLAGTAAMDVTVLVLARTVGVPRSASLDTISDSVAAVAAKAGASLPPSLVTAAVPHLLIGTGLGVGFGGIVARSQALREAPPTKTAALGALYALVATQPFLAAAVIALRMSRAQAAGWYGITLLTHTVFGGVVGAVASYQLRPRR